MSYPTVLENYVYEFIRGLGFDPFNVKNVRIEHRVVYVDEFENKWEEPELIRAHMIVLSSKPGVENE